MQQNRSTRDPSFHANLGSIDIWCEGSQAKSHIASWSSRRTHLVQKIKSMLAYDPTMRPSAQQLLLEITGYDLSRMITTKHSIFGRCCRSCLIPIREHAKELAANKDRIRSLQNNLGKTRKALRKRDLERSGLVAKYERRLNTRQSKITNQRINLRNARKRLENNQSENDRATLKLQRQMADHKGTITRMQAEREMFSKELRKKHAENTRLSKEQIVSNIRLLADQVR
jgi:septal ring factor EnvC (AmiA/AmiB activator)